ncbi:hypothetical protein C6503_19545 [Candidatus Poribacteria bacterium]|nr:MAG: hypothetical protein C6503_19545 [Candidatus Poribacteria bacterium]
MFVTIEMCNSYHTYVVFTFHQNRQEVSICQNLRIETLGTARVKDLGKTVGRRDLVSNYQVYTSCYPSGPYYIFTNMNVETKKELLEEIASELNPPVSIHVEIFHRVSDPDGEPA